MVDLSFVTAIAAYAFVTSITPGPNNTMLLASGTNFGFRASLPHMMGISIGFSLMLIAVGLGIGSFFKAVPAAYSVLRIAGAAYMLYLAWKIATAGSPSAEAAGRSRPFTFFQAAAFQWVNPKAWVLALGVTTTYLPIEGYFTALIAAAIVFAIVNFPSISCWAALGEALRNVLKNRLWLRVFNITMALLLIASLYPIFMTHTPAAH